MPVYFTYSLNADPQQQRLSFFENTDNMIKRQRFYEIISLRTEKGYRKELA
jgi:hypothetical protein